jgi:hypothetical protein
MPVYNAFGLSFNSDIELSPLAISDSKISEVRIIKGAVSETGLDEPTVTKPFMQSSSNELWLHIPQIARFYVINGDTIVVEPAMDADMQSVKLYLLGSCMGAIMYQRNRLVIHGNAIRFGDECVIFAGASGIGKSTLAAAFVKRGYQILADDLSVIDEHGYVQPSYPQVKLWSDTAKKLDIDTSNLERIRLQVKKYAYPLQQEFCTKPLPVKALYILNQHNQEDFIVEPLFGIEKFEPLKRNSYREGYLEGLGLNAEHLKLCASLASKIDISRIIRPLAGFKLDELVELIETDLDTSKDKIA